MVSLTFPALAVLALAPFVTATPTTESTNGIEAIPFSLEQWATDIGNDPDGDHLSVDDAIIALEATLNNTLLEKRDGCNNITGKECRVPDAVYCINEASRKGSQAADVKAGVAQRVWCARGTAQLWGSVSGAVLGEVNKVTYLQVAQAGGRIMDRCTRADGMVQGWSVVKKDIVAQLSTRVRD